MNNFPAEIPQELQAQLTGYFVNLKRLKKEIEGLKKQEEQFKDEALKVFEQFGVTKFDNDFISLTRVAETVKVVLDEEMVKEEQPTLYKELMKKYSKEQKRKAYMRLVVK